VNTAARVMTVAGPGEVLVPSAVRDLVPGSGIAFAEHGVHELKGLEGEHRLHRVVEVDGRVVAPPLGAEEAAERRREIFPSGRSRRTALVVGGGAGLLALALLVAVLVRSLTAGEPARRPTGPLSHAIARIDVGRAAIDLGIPLRGPAPDFHGFVLIDSPIAAGEGGVWLIRPPALLHVDPRHREVRAELIDIGIGQSQTVLTGFDAVWTLSGRSVYRVHPATDEIDEALVLPVPAGITTWSMALGDAIWVGVSDGTLVRFDPRTGARDQADTGLSIDATATTRDRVWVADILAGTLIPFDTESLRRAGRQIEIDGNIDQIVGIGTTLWVLDSQVGVVTRVDATAGRVSGSTRVGNEPTDMAVSPDTVWVGDRDGSVYGIDALTLEPTEIEVGAEVLGVDVDEDDGGLWVYMGRPTADQP
jgi:hypothetical protein